MLRGFAAAALLVGRGPWFARSGTIMHDLGSQRANIRLFRRRSMLLARIHVTAWFVILKKGNLRNVNCMAVLNQVPPPQNSARVSEAENHAYSQRHVAFFNVGTQTSIHVLIVPDA